MLQDNESNNNIDKIINTPEQESNLSSDRRSMRVYVPAERNRTYIQHVSIQANSADKNGLAGEKKNRKVISPLKVAFKSTTKENLSVEGDKLAHLKGCNKNIDKCNFNTAFPLVHIVKNCNESCMED